MWCLFKFAGDISSIVKVYGKAVDRNGETYMDIDKINIDFTMKNARFKVKDNVNSQNVLGRQIADLYIDKHCF